MLLSGVLFVLFLAGCWLYCLADAALTPPAEFRGLSKNIWICIIATTFVVGALAWLVTRRSWSTKSWVTVQGARGTLADNDFTWYSTWTAADAADAAVARHPATRSRREPAAPEPRPKGPDDDPEFLRHLESRIRGTSADSGELSAACRPAYCTVCPARQFTLSDFLRHLITHETAENDVNQPDRRVLIPSFT